VTPATAKVYGLCPVLYEFELEEGEGVRGRPQVIEGLVLATTASGKFEGDISNDVDGFGRLLQMDTVAKSTTFRDDIGKTFGGVTVVSETDDVTKTASYRYFGASADDKFTDAVATTAVQERLPPQPNAFKILRWREVSLD